MAFGAPPSDGLFGVAASSEDYETFEGNKRRGKSDRRSNTVRYSYDRHCALPDNRDVDQCLGRGYHRLMISSVLRIAAKLCCSWLLIAKSTQAGEYFPPPDS